MAKKEKTNLYLLVIVGIVAVVGIIVLILNAGQQVRDVTGQSIEIFSLKKPCKIYCTGDYSCWSKYASSETCGTLVEKSLTTRMACTALDEIELQIMCDYYGMSQGIPQYSFYVYTYWGSMPLDAYEPYPESTTS